MLYVHVDKVVPFNKIKFSTPIQLLSNQIETF